MNDPIESTTVLVLGASGATGRLLVRELLDRGLRVLAVVRDRSRLPRGFLAEPRLTIHEASLLQLGDDRLEELVRGCGAVASCLGHNLTFRGVFGPPRRLVTDAIRRVHRAIEATGGVRSVRPVRLVLMSSAGCVNRGQGERVSVAQRCVVGLLRAVIPPHADNEAALDYLVSDVGADDPRLHWAAVRPDGLTDEDAVTDYEVHASPTRSAIFDAGTTRRADVAHFMAELAAGGEVWDRWRGRTPVIYSGESPSGAGGGLHSSP